ncbi:MAG: Phosphonate ABC transporter phosphate-binding periplasmic component [Candidatus Ozemobacter sibiricus]|uniref:Phosphonate ABC transporter phosphate-binding periplasmic component n=1 Tax=Candidatus Ozemobacter sibiricus TaxID=2268124 RepID=A0A367ZNF8_9BACT|nr:MAG: Phosphonate ABC transporter phosphate-binding periplasmic component [Candidatus Ozemobacter sibiricus]
MAEDQPTYSELMTRGELDGEVPDDVSYPTEQGDAGTSTDFGDPDASEYRDPTIFPVDDDEAPGVYVPPTGPEPKPAAPPPPIRLAQKVVMIGRPPYMNVKGMLQQVKGLTDYLRKEMGVKNVRMVTAKDYASVLSALERGTIDFAWLGPTAFVLGNEKIPLLAIAQAKRRTGPKYYGVFITRKDSGILGIEDIKGRTIGFVDPESASGYLFPLYYLKRAKINPYTYCRQVVFLQKHDAVLNAVLTRKVDVGVCLDDTIETIKDRRILDQIMVLGKTDQVPSDIVACRADCHPVLRDRLQAALLKTTTLAKTATGTPGLAPIMEFLPVNEADLARVREVIKATRDIKPPTPRRP